MSIYFFEANGEQQRCLINRLPGKTPHFSPEPLSTVFQAHDSAADAKIRSALVALRRSSG